MKKFVAVVLLGLAAVATAATEFSLTFEDVGEDKVIAFNKDDWHYVDSASEFEVYIEKGTIGAHKETVRFHAMTVFKEERTHPQISAPYKKIYSYGYLDCKNKVLHILGDMFVDTEETIIYARNHEFGTYMSDMSDKRTIRHQVYMLVCGESI